MPATPRNQSSELPDVTYIVSEADPTFKKAKLIFMQNDTLKILYWYKQNFENALQKSNHIYETTLVNSYPIIMSTNLINCFNHLHTDIMKLLKIRQGITGVAPRIHEFLAIAMQRKVDLKIVSLNMWEQVLVFSSGNLREYHPCASEQNP